jgi:hypothetical protein
MRRKAAAFIVAAIAIAAVYLWYFPFGQRQDRSFDANVAVPAYTAKAPVVMFDAAHYNAHSIGRGFAPFARLVRNDGYEIRESDHAWTAESLQGATILVCVNAAGGSNPKLFGINLEPLRKGHREANAFSPGEIEAVRAWVERGGSLFLIADHYPFGTASQELAKAFGVTMHGGFAGVPAQYAKGSDPSTIHFTSALLGAHPIVRGRNASEQIRTVVSFTGQSLDATSGTAILRLPAGSTEDVPPPPVFKPQPAGAAQAVAIEYGRGRIVVAGEAAMFTAQVADGRRFGMNIAGNDDRQFALNVMHWLSRLI